LAKLSELTDGQLEKAFIRYSQSQKTDPSDKTKAIVLAIQAERKKRQGAITAEAEPLSELEALSRSADAAVKTKQQKQKKAHAKTQFIPRKGQGPALEVSRGNLLLVVGLVTGVLGLVLLADDFLLGWLPELPFKMVLYSVLMVIGVVACKLSSMLMDDNR